MPIRQCLAPAAHTAALLALTVTLGAASCGERSDRPGPGPSIQATSDAPDGDVADTPPPVDPCKLFTDEELAEQLWLTVSPSQREHWNAKGFEIQRTETPAGISRRCEFAFRSRATVSGQPSQIGTFIVMVFRAGLLGVPEQKRKPIPGIGDEAFHHQGVYYVRVGELAMSLTDFGQTSDPGLDPDAPRLALLRLAAQRLH